MIVEALWNLLRGAVETVLGWLPDVDVPDISGSVAGMTAVWQYASWANKYVPLAEAAMLFGLLLLVEAGMTVFRLSVWVLSKAHILGGGSQ